MDKQAILLVHAFIGQGGRDSIEQSYHLPFLYAEKKRRPYRVIPLTIMSLEKRMNDNRDPLCIANKIQEGSSLQGDMEKKHRWLVERKGYRKTGQCPAGL